MRRQQSGLSVAHFGEFELNDWKKAMNPFQPTPMHFTARSPSWSDDVEMLQTDVMRFFAILCLCLMAIFALVKALPMASPVEAPTILEPTNLKSDSQVLQEEIAALKKKACRSPNSGAIGEDRRREIIGPGPQGRKNRTGTSRAGRQSTTEFGNGLSVSQ